ncbi:hypothetical protein KJE20_13612 [Pyrenophora tritici-repentis]|uniref:Uncharacterized protein n=1 Tax=Pyrenophora tritici-repentis TaxID=45151 RepID=A0A922NLY5_9PLEO|nr:hypothetical protein Ptr86124_003681 [Pyrenophora tritici-repentis]KAI1676849.1 hypothetical protein KJE20_13612 [Pyrenophora tritici-repentis]
MSYDTSFAKLSSNIKLLYLLISLNFAILALVIIGGSVIRQQPDVEVSASTSRNLPIPIAHCGATPAAARARGCIFESNNLAWVPPQCYDHELGDEWDAKNWSYAYGDDKELVSKEQVFQGEFDYLWVTWGQHIAHCALMVRLDVAFEPTTPLSEDQSCNTPFSIESNERQFFNLDFATNQDIPTNDYHQLLPPGNDEADNVVTRKPDWTPESFFNFPGDGNQVKNCSCIYSLLYALQSMTPINDFNDATKMVSCETLGTMRSSFSACERLVQCPHVHQSACIMLLLAVLQCIDDILYRMTVVFKEECKAAMETRDNRSGGNNLNGSFLRRGDLMRGIMVLAAARSMDQTEYGVEKNSLRPVGTLLEYISKLQNNFEARMLELC